MPSVSPQKEKKDWKHSGKGAKLLRSASFALSSVSSVRLNSRSSRHWGKYEMVDREDRHSSSDGDSDSSSSPPRSPVSLVSTFKVGTQNYLPQKPISILCAQDGMLLCNIQALQIYKTFTILHNFTSNDVLYELIALLLPC